MSIVKAQRIYVHDREMTLETAALAFEAGVEPQDNTRLQGNTRVSEAGLLTFAYSLEGFWSSVSDTDTVDGDMFAKLGLASHVVTVMPAGAAPGDLAYFLEALQTEYTPFGSGEVGGSHRFALAGVARGRGHRGAVLHRGNMNTTGSGTAVNLGSANNRNIFAALHLVTVSGTTPNLVVRIQRDDTSGMVSPTNEITFPGQNARTSNVQGPEPGGGASDVWWRADWTVTGTSPAFAGTVVMAIVD